MATRGSTLAPNSSFCASLKNMFMGYSVDIALGYWNEVGKRDLAMYCTSFVKI